ncbi:hypothetical protein HK405_014341 [Cladochytrium tenue]|nr:hypothetical protein HK405_014341 [Cladochytrium tenue]
MPLGHVSLGTGQDAHDKMRNFYIAALRPLGYGVFKDLAPHCIGFGPVGGIPDFWLHCGSADGGAPSSKTHVAFVASSPAMVRMWHAAALAAGGRDNGAPGPRPQYTPGYYAAFVLDPLGNNVEAFHLDPLWMKALRAAPLLLAGLAGAALGFALAARRFH